VHRQLHVILFAPKEHHDCHHSVHTLVSAERLLSAGKRLFSAFAQDPSSAFSLVFIELFRSHFQSASPPPFNRASFRPLHTALLLGSFIALLLGKRRISCAFFMALLFYLLDNTFLLLSMGVFPLLFWKCLFLVLHAVFLWSFCSARFSFGFLS
jgi:hypothetical protein